MRVVDHDRNIKESYSALSRFQKAIFLCLVCERQYPVYVQYADGKDWANISGLRQLLNECWEWSISFGRAPSPSMPNSHDFLKVVGGLAGVGLEADPFWSIEYLIDFIVNQEGNLAGYSAEKGTIIIDAYLDEYKYFDVEIMESKALIDHHPLMVQEMRRQNDDMQHVQRENWKLIDWQDVRKQVVGQSVLTLRV
ncbi:MAG: DUF416 family protein [Pseudomonadota bacterium]